MKITFLGAAHEVTGSCTLLETGNHKILIDCGMEQGKDVYENCEMPMSLSDIDCMFLTHAHIDHSGKIPLIGANGFKGSIFTTEATRKLCSIMLMDSAHIQQQDAVWKNRKAKRSGDKEVVPMYTTEDVQAVMPQFVPCDYGKVYKIYDDLSVKFIDAGHLMGSASIEITAVENGEEKVILFSGDIGNVDRPLINDPTKPEKADIVIIESTYGNRLHGERPDYASQLTRVIQETFDRGGNVVIPSFAVGRTQELLYLIREIKEANAIKNHADFPVWVDSPLAVEATEIYGGELEEFYDSETLALLHKGINVLKFQGLHTAVSEEDSRAINDDPSPKVIISASGMCEAGRIRHHLKHNLWRTQSTILFVGYQAEGTLGRKIIEGAPSVKLFGEDIQVKANIEKMEGISGHADRDMLLGWLKNLKNKPEQVFVNHGEDLVCDEFAATVKDNLGFNALAPYNGAEYDLISGECLNKGNNIRIEQKKESWKHERNSFIYDKLLLAGNRLLAVIRKNKECSNKEISKFTLQINELSNKWDR